MKNVLTIGLACGVLAGCNSGEPEAAQFICVNGPDLVAVYKEDGVQLRLNNDRIFDLTRPDPDRPNLYTNADGVRWAESTFDARFDFDRRSFLCDKLS
ncbi:MAG: hypothetical protein AAF762_08480 [Pseudomonadota bacterium]